MQKIRGEPQIHSSSLRRKASSHRVFQRKEVLTGRYVLGEKIGIGGLCVAYSAHDLETLDDVCIKIGIPTLGNAFTAQYIDREVDALSRIDSERVVRLLGDGTSKKDGRRFMVLELIEGETLKHVLNQGPIPWAAAKPIMLQICEGLEAIHSADVLHRDVKPHNIMMLSDIARTNIKMIDLGLATFTDRPDGGVEEITERGNQIGTISYLPPEANHAPHIFYDVRSEIHAVGAVMYEMLTSRSAYRCENALQTMLKIKHEMPAPMRDLGVAVPPRVEDIVLQCLAKIPTDRFASITELREAILSC